MNTLTEFGLNSETVMAEVDGNGTILLRKHHKVRAVSTRITERPYTGILDIVDLNKDTVYVDVLLPEKAIVSVERNVLSVEFSGVQL